MRYYPVNLDLKGRNVLIVGGGMVAEARTRSLIDAGANVRVVSPSLTGEMREWARGAAIVYLAREFQPEDIEGAVVVICATDVRTVNEEVSRIANAKGVLCNVVDRPELCNFITPSILMRGDIQITVSTGGRSPTVGQLVRKLIGEAIGNEFSVLLDLSAELRSAAKSASLSFEERRDLLNAFAESEALDLIRNGEVDQARNLSHSLLRSLLNGPPAT